MAEVIIGTASNPIIFTGVTAGEAFSHPNNPFYLWNDKGGIRKSVDAKELVLSVLGFSIIDEIVGVSTGSASQTFTVSYAPIIGPDSYNPIEVKVNGVIWSSISSFASAGSSDLVYTIDSSTGVITFGDGVNGAIPAGGSPITITYTPDTTQYGSEIQEFQWLGVKSSGVISNNVSVSLERAVSSDEYHVTTAHKNIVTVTGVWLNTDSHRFGTNYYTGGSFNSSTGVITLGTILPNTYETVFIDYTYTIIDDAEAAFTQIGGPITHAFLNPIPNNNAKAVYLQILAPATTSPSGLINLQFRIRLDYNA